MSELENRVAAIEQELAEIKKTLSGNGDSKPWWERIAGLSAEVGFPARNSVVGEFAAVTSTDFS